MEKGDAVRYYELIQSVISSCLLAIGFLAGLASLRAILPEVRHVPRTCPFIELTLLFRPSEWLVRRRSNWRPWTFASPGRHAVALWPRPSIYQATQLRPAVRGRQDELDGVAGIGNWGLRPAEADARHRRRAATWAPGIWLWRLFGARGSRGGFTNG